jgi:glycosyltransferase involved in cell wall biosynthesis
VFLMTNTLETGGSERQFATLSNAIRRENFEVKLGCLGRRGLFLDQIGEIAEFPPGGSLFGWHSLQARAALARYLKTQRVTLAHSFDFYSNLMMIPAARMAGVPVVVGSLRNLGNLISGRRFAALKMVLRLSDHVMCNSGAAAQRLRDAGFPERKLSVLPNALPEEVFAETVPALPGQSGVVRIGMIARMNHAVKNHPCFLRVASRLAPKFPQAEFVLVGDGPLRGEVESLAGSLGIAQRVSFMGERRDIPAVLASLDVSVQISRSESLSNVILESMAAGVPVVATNVGGTPEVVREGETGFLVPPDDDNALCSALEKLLGQPELRRRVGNHARLYARENFSLGRVRDCCEDLYRSYLAEKGWQAAVCKEPPFSLTHPDPRQVR